MTILTLATFIGIGSFAAGLLGSLTGLGGGVFERPMAMDDNVGTPDVMITADVVDFCRLAAQRIAPQDLDASIEGDPALADLVLAAASAFARD